MFLLIYYKIIQFSGIYLWFTHFWSNKPLLLEARENSIKYRYRQKNDSWNLSFSGIMLRVWSQNFIQRLPWGPLGLHFFKKQPITLASRMAKLISLTHLSNNSHVIPLKTSKPNDQIQTISLNGVSKRDWAFILPTSSTVTVRGAWWAPQGVREYTWNKIIAGATLGH